MQHLLPKLSKGIAVLSLVGLLAACATTNPNDPTHFNPPTTVTVVTHTVYPELAEINVPKSPALKPVKFDFPRDAKASMVIKQTTACLSVTKENQDINFWAACGEFPVDLNSNVFIGLTQADYNNLTFNLVTLQQYVALLKGRIAIANEQRADQNAKAKQETTKNKTLLTKKN